MLFYQDGAFTMALQVAAVGEAAMANDIARIIIRQGCRRWCTSRHTSPRSDRGQLGNETPCRSLEASRAKLRRTKVTTHRLLLTGGRNIGCAFRHVGLQPRRVVSAPLWTRTASHERKLRVATRKSLKTNACFSATGCFPWTGVRKSRETWLGPVE